MANKIQNNSFVQKNGIEIKEEKVYKSHVGDLVKIISIDVEKNEMKCYNISDSCNAWHRIDRAITDNKFEKLIKG